MARVIQEAYNLLAAVDYLVVADLGSFSERHGAAIRILSNVRDASEQVLHFAGLLPDCLRQHNVQTVGIGALGAAYARVPLPAGGYTMDHTSSLFLIGPDGRLAATSGGPHDAEVMARDFRVLVARGAAN